MPQTNVPGVDPIVERDVGPIGERSLRGVERIVDGLGVRTKELTVETRLNNDWALLTL